MHMYLERLSFLFYMPSANDKWISIIFTFIRRINSRLLHTFQFYFLLLLFSIFVFLQFCIAHSKYVLIVNSLFHGYGSKWYDASMDLLRLWFSHLLFRFCFFSFYVVFLFFVFALVSFILRQRNLNDDII